MSESGTVLLVEDDRNILRTNRRILEREGFRVLCAETLEEARARLASDRPDVLVLDIELPDGSGVAFCRDIRPALTAPVLFLTGRDEEDDVVRGLAAGGNDYITKPYSIEVLAARVKAQLRLARMNRAASEQARAMVRGPLTMDLVALRATLNGEDMGLSAREFSVLLFLLKNEGRTLSAQEIYEGAWNQPMAGSTNAVWTCLSRLKSKLEPCREQISLMNFRGKGYLLEILPEQG